MHLPMAQEGVVLGQNTTELEQEYKAPQNLVTPNGQNIQSGYSPNSSFQGMDVQRPKEEFTSIPSLSELQPLQQIGNNPTVDNYYNPNDNQPQQNQLQQNQTKKKRKTFDEWRKTDKGYNTLSGIQTAAGLGTFGTNVAESALNRIGTYGENQRAQNREAEYFRQAAAYKGYDDRPLDTQYDRNALSAAYGMQIKEMGGYGEPNVEVEGKEHIQLPNGFSQEIQGASHANGGIPLNLPEGSKVFSENLKDPQTKKSYADLAKKFETKKNYDMLNSKRGDAIQKSTAEMMIKFKNNKLNDLFSMQEEDKMSGVHGLKPMMETMQNQQPMAKYGMKLPKAQGGISVPAAASDIIKNYKLSPTYKYINDAENVKKGGERLIEQMELNGVKVTPEMKSEIFKAKSFKELDKFAPQLQEATWNLHPEASKHFGLNVPPTRKGLQYLLDNKLVDPKDFPTLIKNGKVAIGSMKGYPNTEEAKKLESVISTLPEDKKSKFSEVNYKDSEFYYRNPEFKKFSFKNKAEYDKYVEDNKSNLYGDSYYSGTPGLYLQPDYPAETPIIPDKPVTEIPSTKETPVTKTEYIYEKPEIGFDLSIPLPGNVYGRSPLNYYQIEPDYIDPRYLDVQPQLNQVARGQRAIQSNLGGRGSTDIANMLQAQANADTQRGQVYGQKYNYDRAQDAAAQQYNAGMKSQTDMFNQGTWFNQLENPIRQREGAIDTQQRTDQQNAIENMRRSQAFSRNENFINDTYRGLQNLTPEQRDAIIFGNTAFNDKSKKTTTKTDKVEKYGGKIKIKPKLRRR